VLVIHAKQLLLSTPSMDSHRKSKPLWISAVTDALGLIVEKIWTNFERHLSANHSGEFLVVQ
jgi:hypothetical protein